MWNKKRIKAELKRLKEYWNMQEYSMSAVVDYITLHPRAVRRDFFNALMKEDFPEFRKKAE